MYVFAFKLIRFGQSFFCATFAVHFICQFGFVIGNPSGSRLEILGRKPLWKNGSSSVMSTLMNRPLLAILSSRAPITVTASLGQPGFPNNVILYLVRPRCLGPFPERLKLPFSSDDILSGYEDLVSSGSDRFTMWGEMGPHEVLAEHVVDIHKVKADFRNAFERKQSSSSQTHGVNKYFSSQSPVQRRLSIYDWNPGPRRGREDAFEKQIAESHYKKQLSMSIMTFLPTHYAGFSILFNKDTFYPDINVKSIYLHDTRRGLPDQIIEGEQGWVLQGVLSRASFRRAAVSGQKFFTRVVPSYQQHLR